MSKYSYFSTVIALIILSNLPTPYNSIGISGFILFLSIYVRWINVSLVQIAKEARQDHEKVVAGLNASIRIVNDHTSLLKRMKFMENDVDGISTDLNKAKSDIKKLKSSDHKK
jgi:uncharacterized protein YoxC